MKYIIKMPTYSIIFKIMSLFFILLIFIFNMDVLFAGKINKKLKVNEPAIDFTLEDADGNSFSLIQTRGKIIILSVAAYSDSKELRKKYFKENGDWIEAIKQKYNNKCIVIGMGKLDISAPLKVFARRQIRESHSVRFIIDWKGDVYEIYGHEFSPTIILIDRDGIVREIAVGTFTTNSAQDLFNKIDAVL